MEDPKSHQSPERFTVDGSDPLESRLKELCDQSLKGVQSLIPEANLEAVLLGGGYGRGEGGVLRLPDGDHPYNDLEFFVMVKGGSVWTLDRKYGPALHELGERMSPDAGLDVEFKIFSLPRLRQAPVNMFYYDLVARSRWILGEEKMLQGCEHHLNAKSIPLHEATRLLMNRTSGLLFSKAKLALPDRNEADKDFVGRNLSKLDLAFGDVILTSQGLYHWSCIERKRRLEIELQESSEKYPAEFQKLLEPYQTAVEFKQHPTRSNSIAWDELESAWEQRRMLSEQVWIWLESKRLGTAFKSGTDYADWNGNLCPESIPLKNFLINLKTFKSQSLRRPLFRYPREFLFRSLALTLWETPDLKVASNKLATQLNIPTGANLQQITQAYTNLWNRYN